MKLSSGSFEAAYRPTYAVPMHTSLSAAAALPVAFDQNTSRPDVPEHCECPELSSTMLHSRAIRFRTSSGTEVAGAPGGRGQHMQPLSFVAVVCPTRSVIAT